MLALLLLPSTARAQPRCTIGQPDCCDAVADCDDGNPCTDEVCDPDRVCRQTDADGASCSDGDACTQTDTCQGGACVGSDPVVCTAPDQCRDPGTCHPATGACEPTPKGAGEPCDDGNACTGTAACDGAGACVGSDPVVCLAIDDCHLPGTCNRLTGACTHPAKPDGADCDDGDACTRIDACDGGVCFGSDPVVCAPSDDCHDAGTCNPATGACSDPPKPGGSPCDDANACTTTDVCQGGNCIGLDPVVCAPSDQCHDAGQCDPGTGVCSDPPKPAGSPCDDGNACTRVDACQAGDCAGADPVTCPASDQCHLAGTCDPASGLCSDPIRPDGAPCDDADACTRSDTCRAGGCTGADEIVCNDDVPCTRDQCVGGSCRFEPRSERCDDGTCSIGECRPEAAGADLRGCVAVPVLEGDACTDDGWSCTEDVCRAGTCVHAGVDERCTPSDTCGTAVCFPGFPTADTAGCAPGTPMPDGGACAGDDDPCTDDQCARGACAHPNVPDRRTCEPVVPAYRRATALRGAAAALTGVLAASATDGGVAARTRELLDARLAAIAGDLDVVVGILGGQRPVNGSGSVAQRRARTSLPLAGGLVSRARSMVTLVKTGRRAGAVSPAAAGTLSAPARALLAGAKALKRDLRRIQRISRVFAR